MTKSKGNLFFPLLCMALCLIFPSVCAAGARKGLSVSLEAALPAIYPALILSCLLVRLATPSKEKAFLLPFFLGLVCGFPVGAATVSGLVQNQTLSKKDGERLLFFCNNASPAFLISYCGETILKDFRKGVLLFFLQSVLSAACLFFFFGKRIFAHKKEIGEKTESKPLWWKSLPLALRDATNSFIYIISCIIFFSFLTELLRHLFSLKNLPLALLGIFSELCGGLDRLQSLAPHLAFPLCALGCGFGGCSVHLQTAGILENATLSPLSHLKGKLFFATVLFILALFFEKLL